MCAIFIKWWTYFKRNFYCLPVVMLIFYIGIFTCGMVNGFDIQFSANEKLIFGLNKLYDTLPKYRSDALPHGGPPLADNKAILSAFLYRLLKNNANYPNNSSSNYDEALEYIKQKIVNDSLIYVNYLVSSDAVHALDETKVVLRQRIYQGQSICGNLLSSDMCTEIIHKLDNDTVTECPPYVHNIKYHNALLEQISPTMEDLAEIFSYFAKFNHLRELVPLLKKRKCRIIVLTDKLQAVAEAYFLPPEFCIGYSFPV